MGECAIASTLPSYVFQIRDRSEDPSCDLEAPGSDILGVQLFDRDDVLIGHGEYVGSYKAQNINAAEEFEAQDGTSDFALGSCPASAEDAISLFCGGWIAFQFRDANGERLEMRSGWKVQVYEFGATCNDARQAGEWYQARICRNPNAVADGDDSSCTIEILNDFGGGPYRLP